MATFLGYIGYILIEAVSGYFVISGLLYYFNSIEELDPEKRRKIFWLGLISWIIIGLVLDFIDYLI